MNEGEHVRKKTRGGGTGAAVWDERGNCIQRYVTRTATVRMNNYTVFTSFMSLFVSLFLSNASRSIYLQ